MIPKSKQVLLLWLEGFREACSLHRVVILCHRSRKLLLRTGQCFLLNGLIFLGSLGMFKWFIDPALWWILPDQCSPVTSQEFCSYGGFYAFLRGGLLQLFYVFWFYPLYMLSFILSNIWYNDIAKLGFEAMEKSDLSSAEALRQGEGPTSQNLANSGLGGVMIGIGEQVYSMLLLTFFFLEVYVVGIIPYIGKILNFLLLSWMYAYYCYEYKWNFSGIPLEKRLDFFESNWAFFAGFGSPCVLAIFFLSPLVSGALMAILFPLFVLTATGSGPEKSILAPRRTWKCAGLWRLPIFYAADTLSMLALSIFRLDSPHQMQHEKTG
ncbi:PREDICTED: protein EI24 homolog isoform X1 [Camelina sativa]|uniref:Protein EI24 homolog isoform X1 n=2 Tax=Camelina sativa TaxID=90675 RepID=A0ABM0VF35_CAMSA|nr:PREDICTED: protein EI24 homolog isoform X1 [Camelina sativa]